SWPCAWIVASSVRYSSRRSTSLWGVAGSGGAPTCASTTRRWTLLDPISSTAKRIRSVYPVRGLGRRFLRGLFFPLTVERIGRCFAGRRGDGLGAQGRPPSFQSDLEKVNSGERLAKNAS